VFLRAGNGAAKPAIVEPPEYMTDAAAVAKVRAAREDFPM
jgi:hypothetical protein